MTQEEPQVTDSGPSASPEAQPSALPSEPSSTSPAVHRAPHVGQEFDRMIQIVANRVADISPLHRVAHYTSGIYDFGVDVLDDPALARPDSEGGVAVRRGRYLRGGQNLTFVVGQEDDRLQDLRTGRLIRTVLQSDNGTIYCMPVRRGEYLTGLSLDKSRVAVDRADDALASLVSDLRADLGFGFQDPGGWRTARPVGSVAALPDLARTDLPDSVVAYGDESQAGAATLRNAVTPRDLHYLEVRENDKTVYAVDCLDSPAIQHLFTQMTPESRRRGYAEQAKRFRVLAEQLSQLMRAAVSGRLSRVVLDVEQGAIYYYRLPGNAYMIGVTLIQSMVGIADQRMAKLVTEYAGLRDEEPQE